MKKTVKRVLCAVLCLAIIQSMAAMVFAAPSKVASDSVTASLKNIYDDSMLFQQNDDAVFAGKGTAGSKISCVLIDESGSVIRQSQTTVENNGDFSLSFVTPAGAYKSYTVKFYVDGNEFRVLKDVVFGELWLASGQSNMQYALPQCEEYEQSKNCSEWIRFLHIDPFTTYHGRTDEFPIEAQDDIEVGSCRWLKGSEDNLENVSAVSFFFAKELQKKLDMPVGVLMPNLGGSMLASWLSRETIDSDTVFADYLKKKDMYVSVDDWDNNKAIWYSTVTINYNTKLAPLKDFSIAGMIWYQGESEILCTWDIGYYERGLELLQSSYSKLFGFDKPLPFIAAQVAPFAYGDNKFNLHNNEFIDFQKKDPSSRAVTTIYDIGLDYLPELGSIHPMKKQLVGERMSACADGLVYKNGDCYTAATVESYRADGNDFYVTFNGVGDGLSSFGKKLNGFALSGEGGVYVGADAEIVSQNTVKIHCDQVKNPVSATYAFAENNNNSNLYSTQDGKAFLPVAPFSTNIAGDKLYWEDPAWVSCDSDNAWLLSSESNAGINTIWSAENAQLTIDKNTQFSGDGCLNVVTEKQNKKFSVSPVFSFVFGKKKKYFDKMMRDWRYYSSVSVMVRNNSSKDVTLKEMRIYTNSVTWYAPEVNNIGEPCITIPADGQWHKLTFDLNSLYLFGNECGATYSRKKLSNIKNFELNFNGSKNQDFDISIDEFIFTPDASTGSGARFDTNIKYADNVFEFISSLFVVTIGSIINVFTK